MLCHGRPPTCSRSAAGRRQQQLSGASVIPGSRVLQGPAALGRPSRAHAGHAKLPLRVTASLGSSGKQTGAQSGHNRQQQHTTNPSSTTSSSSSADAPHIRSILTSCAAAAVVLAGSWVAPGGWPLAPSAAGAKARMTPDEQLTVDIFKKSTPSVVNVTNLATRRDAFTMNMLEIPQGAGSGFVWDDSGRVVTNYHVITDASDLQVTFSGGSEFPAKVIGVDQDKDIAVLEVREAPPLPQGEGDDAAALLPVSSSSPAADTSAKGPGPFTPLSLCSSSSDLLVGQRVFAIGNPFGLDHTLTTGVVSGTGREIQSISGRPIQDVIQTDAAINPGNSGGPLLDSSGCLIGINTAIYSPSGANSGVGFAIPVDTVRSSVDQIIKYGKVVRPILGISFAPDQSSEQLGVKGILVLSSREGGPAWKAGIRGTSRDEYGRLVLGDIIVGINGSNVRNSSDLYKLLDKCDVGQALDIEVLRGDAKQHVTATLEANA